MALNDISIGKKKTGSGAVVKVPEKTTMNFARRGTEVNLSKLVPLVLVVIAAVLLFVWLGFQKPLAEKAAANSELAAKQAQLDAYAEKLQEYEALQQEYGRYSYGWMSESETGLVDRTEILSLLEDEILKKATVENYAVNDNVLTLNLSGLSLKEAGTMVDSLESNPIVESATVYSSSSDADGTGKIYMSIILEKEAEAE